MDGSSHYVTVRRDLFEGLVAATPVTAILNPTSTPLSQQTITLSEEVSPTLVTENIGNPIECSLCSMSFTSKNQLTRHLKTHSLVGSPKSSSSTSAIPIPSDKTPVIYKCDHAPCGGRVFANHASLVRHAKTQHGIVELENSSSPILTEVQIQRADSTGSVTGTKRHHGEKRFQCGQCNKRFPTSKDLKRHDVVHTGNREFQCSFCSHRFGRKDHRMRHEKKTHANELSIAAAAAAANGTNAGAPLSPPITKDQISITLETDKRRWRHLSSPSLAMSSSPTSTTSTDVDMSRHDHRRPARMRAMSTCEQRRDGPLYKGSNLRGGGGRTSSCSGGSSVNYNFENQLSPESLFMQQQQPPVADATMTSAEVDVSSTTMMIKEEEVSRMSLEDQGHVTLQHPHPPPLIERSHHQQQPKEEVKPEVGELSAPQPQPVGGGDLDWIMNDFMKYEEADELVAPRDVDVAEDVSALALLSPESPDTTTTTSSQLTPDPPSSMSPTGLYPDTRPHQAHQGGGRQQSSSSPMSTGSENLYHHQQQHQSHDQPQQQQQQQLPQPHQLASSAPPLSCPKQLLSDFLTRTKNPVLPSVYIDNTLIVPQPSKQKYSSHNVNQPFPAASEAGLANFMMDDYYENFVDEKEITENLL